MVPTSKMSCTEYVKAKHRATMKGEWYEVKVAALLFLRSKNSDWVTRFQLATNVEGAGALDDIVYRLLSARDPHTWRTSFIQLKHKDKKTLTVSSFTGSSGDFSLKKYLKSYNEIKKAYQENGSVNNMLFEGLFENFQFVIYTNSKAGESMMKRKSSGDSFTSKSAKKVELEELLQSNVDEKLVYQFTREIDEDVFSSLEEVQGAHGDVTEFLEKLIVFTGQPPEGELDDIIKKELSIACGGEVTDCGAIYRVFEGLFKQWWRDSNIILDETSDILQRAIDQLSYETELMKQTEQLTLDLNFDERIWKDFNTSFSDGVSLVIVVTDGMPLRLSATKVLRLLQAERLSFTFIAIEYLLQHQSDLISDWRDGYKDCLVVVANHLQDTNTVAFTSLCVDIVKVMKGNPDKKAVVVSHEIRPRKFGGLKYKVMSSKFNFTDLDESSIANILGKEVSFQNHKIQLRSLYDGDLNFWKTLLSADILGEFIISKHIIVIGAALPSATQHYIPRKLKRNMILDDGTIQSETLSDVFALLFGRSKQLSEFVDPDVDAIKVVTQVNSSTSSPFHEINRSRFLKLHGSGAAVKYNDMCHEPAIAPLVRVKSDKVECGYIQKYVHIPNTNPINVASRCEIIPAENVLNTDEKVILVIAEPGMGKSTLLLTLAQTAKKDNPSDWVIYINLRDHSELFNQSPQLSVFEFFATGLRIESPWEKAFLLVSLNQTGNIVVFLDSFDVICPRYIEEGGSLLTNILKTKFKKLVVTSRHSSKHILEEHLLTPHLLTLVYNIVEFSEDDRKMFLLKLWSQSPLSNTTSQLEDVVTKLIDSVNAIDPERTLMGIPLHTMMLADVFGNYVREPESQKVLKKLNVLNLLEQFVENKFLIFFGKGNTSLNKGDSQRKFYEDHMHAALALFLSNESIQNLVTDCNIIEHAKLFFRNIEEGKDNSGIVINIVKQKPNFLHDMFAEYFAGLWFSENYHSNSEFLKKHLFLPNSNVIRNMFDRILAKGSKLHEAVLDNDMQLVEKLLSVDSIDVNARRDHGGRTALHLAASMECPSSSDGIENVMEHRFIGPRPRHMVELLLDHGASVNVTDVFCQWTPMEYALAINSWAAIEDLLASNVDTNGLVLTDSSIRNIEMMTVIFRNRYIHLFSVLIDKGLPVTFIPYKFRFTSIRGDIVGVQPFLHIASSYGNVEFVELLLSHGADKYGRDADNNVPLHFASLCGHVNVLRILVESSSKVTISTYWNTKYKFNWFRKYVNCTNSRGQSALHCAMTSEIALALISYGADIWLPDCQKRLCLHTASRFGRLSVVEAIIGSLGQNRRVIDKLIKTVDIKGKSAISLASQHGHSDVVSFLGSHTQESQRKYVIPLSFP